MGFLLRLLRGNLLSWCEPASTCFCGSLDRISLVVLGNCPCCRVRSFAHSPRFLSQILLFQTAPRNLKTATGLPSGCCFHRHRSGYCADCDCYYCQGCCLCFCLCPFPALRQVLCWAVFSLLLVDCGYCCLCSLSGSSGQSSFPCNCWTSCTVGGCEQRKRQ